MKQEKRLCYTNVTFVKLHICNRGSLVIVLKT